MTKKWSVIKNFRLVDRSPVDESSDEDSSVEDRSTISTGVLQLQSFIQEKSAI
jgi:hypothetical protein